ncbi:MAG: FHA domain-containing protein [Pseudomonadota bacterium]
MSTNSGPLSSSCAAKLLLAAAALDMAVVVLITKFIASLSPAMKLGAAVFAGTFRGSELQAANVLLWFLPCLLLYWLLVELLLGGASLGRIAMQLKPMDSSGKPISFGQRAQRTIWKLGTCGLSGCHPGQPALYDRKARVTWHSPIAPQTARAMTDWTLKIRSGNSAGRTPMALGSYSNFSSSRKGLVKIGRDQSKVDLALPGDNSVSGAHAAIEAKDGVLSLIDMGSSNGTYIGSKKLQPNKRYSLKGVKSFKLGGVVIELQR